MSQENVDTVRRAWEASSQHDNQTVFDLYDPDVEITFEGSVVRHLRDGVHRGADGGAQGRHSGASDAGLPEPS